MIPIADIETESRRLGFSQFGTCDLPDSWEAQGHLKSFIEANYHGQMQWLADSYERRSHPQNMWQGARSAIVLGVNYGPDFDPLAGLEAHQSANISVYARGDDYHDVIKKNLKALARFIVDKADCELKVFVDTAPLMEKPLAQLAGVGWQGKHTNIVSREFGSWLFLGVILLDQPISQAIPETDHCGTCRACLDACPTNAFVAPYQMDARLCLSYLTIEHKGPWPEDLRALMGNRLYGCDDCLAVCPWNKYAKAGQEAKLIAREGFDQLPLTTLARLDDAAFRALFAKSPIKRIGVVSFLRNVAYALGNSWRRQYDETILFAIEHLMVHDNEIVRDAANWAIAQRRTDAAI